MNGRTDEWMNNLMQERLEEWTLGWMEGRTTEPTKTDTETPNLQQDDSDKQM